MAGAEEGQNQTGDQDDGDDGERKDEESGGGRGAVGFEGGSVGTGPERRVEGAGNRIEVAVSARQVTGIMGQDVLRVDLPLLDDSTVFGDSKFTVGFVVKVGLVVDKSTKANRLEEEVFKLRSGLKLSDGGGNFLGSLFGGGNEDVGAKAAGKGRRGK